MTHRQRQTACETALNYIDFGVSSIALLFSFAYLIAMDFERAKASWVILIVVLAARPLGTLAVSVVQLVGFKAELTRLLVDIDAAPNATTVEEMVSHVEGDRQLRLMTQLIALM